MDLLISDLIAFIFLLASMVYSYLGFYGIGLNNKNSLNRIFFFLCLTISFWTGCFALMTSRKVSYATALHYNHISVLGWGVCYSILYHFSIKVQNLEKTLPRKRLFLIYFPSVLNIIFFSPVFFKSYEVFNMVKTKYGWTNVTPRNFSNIYFTIYALVFSILTIKEFYNWGKHASKKIKTRVRAIAFSYVLALIGGVFTDVMLNRILKYETIQVTCLLLGIPIFFMFYVLLRYRVIHPFKKIEKANVVDDKTRELLFRIVGYTYVGISYFTVYFFYMVGEHKLTYAPQLALFIYFVGILNFFSNDIFVTVKTRYAFVVLNSCLLMVGIAKLYGDNPAVTVWGFFFWCILITSVFENIKYSIVLYISMVILQLAHFMKNPVVFVKIDYLDYVLRIFICTIMIIEVVYINTIYRRRIKENIEQSDIQKLITNLTATFIDINVENIGNKVKRIIKGICDYFGYERGYICKLEKNNKYSILYYYDINKNREKIETIMNIPEIRTKADNQTFYVDIEELESKDEYLLNYLKKENIQGFYSLLIDNVENCNIAIVFEYNKQKRFYTIYHYYDIIRTLSSDILNKLNYQRKLYYNANFDKVTGIRNIDSFKSVVKNLLLDKGTNKSAVLFVDINAFKNINEAFGYNIGDIVLKDIAQRLRGYCKEEDEVCRATGDEFLIYFHNVKNKEEVEKRVQDILENKTFNIIRNECELKINFNIGVAMYPANADNVEDLIKASSFAMNESKKAGKFSYKFVSDEDKNKMNEIEIFTNKLYTAVENDEIIVYYQPQIDINTEKMIGAEALMRWKTTPFGLVQPFKFIHILEKTGLIIDCGMYLMEKVMKFQKKIKEEYNADIRMAVNLSVIQFQDVNLANKIKLLIKKYSVDTNYFEFEITESIAANKGNEFLRDNFYGIKKTGSYLAIDDFGVEFSSLSRLQSLEVDRLKIDKSFIDGIGIDVKKEAVIIMIINLAKSMNLKTIAEGVETKEQLEFLRKEGCDEIQGYYYAKPMSESDFIEYLKKHI